jgi:hypothetical protein
MIGFIYQIGKPIYQIGKNKKGKDLISVPLGYNF